MDILAARKKAAEKAKAHQADADGKPAAPARQPMHVEEPERAEPVIAEETEELLGGFPPLPDTSFVPDEPEPAPASEPLPFLEKTQAASAIQHTAAAEKALILPLQADEPDDEPEEREQELEMLAFLLGSEEYVVP